MKTFLPPTVAFLLLCTTSSAQLIGYYLPEKKLRITVTYRLKGYALKNDSDGAEQISKRRYEMTIDDMVKVEEIIVPDPHRHFELSLPHQVSKGGARFDWALKLDRNGVLAGWNASREPIGAAVISGAAGFVANLLTGVAHLQGIVPAQTEASYQVITDQKITVAEIVDIPAGGLQEKVVAQPRPDAAVADVLAATPSVSVTVTDTGTGVGTPDDKTTTSREVLYYVMPGYYRLTVTVRDNGLIKHSNVIDHMLIVPQHGQLKHIALSELFRGRRSASVSIDPSTGQLLTWLYARDGNTKADLADINKQWESLNKAILGITTAQDLKLKQEVARLELELDKLKLLQELQRQRE